MNDIQNKVELAAFDYICAARDRLAPFADKAETDPGYDAQLGDIWDEIRKVKVRLMSRLFKKGLLEFEPLKP